jgi:pimeloyl-ACP methyl ester carboxylesterase
MEEFFKKVTSEDLLIDSAMLGVPTLLIYGSEDKATPPLYGRLYHESIDDSTLQIVEGAGHYVFVDKPAQTLALIKDFLK